MLIVASVGRGGVNRNDDVRVVQALLNDWRAKKNLCPIAVDGSAGPETRGAITAFQQQATGLVDGAFQPFLRAAQRSCGAQHVDVVIEGDDGDGVVEDAPHLFAAVRDRVRRAVEEGEARRAVDPDRLVEGIGRLI